MQTKNRLFDDIAKVAISAAGTFAGMKEEIENMVRHRVESILIDMNMVNRDEFNAVKEMVSKSRIQQERLEENVKKLESRINQSSNIRQQRKKTAAKKRKTTK